MRAHSTSHQRHRPPTHFPPALTPYTHPLSRLTPVPSLHTGARLFRRRGRGPLGRPPSERGGICLQRRGGPRRGRVRLQRMRRGGSYYFLRRMFVSGEYRYRSRAWGFMVARTRLTQQNRRTRKNDISHRNLSPVTRIIRTHNTILSIVELRRLWRQP